jgi:predicted DNA-binding protein
MKRFVMDIPDNLHQRLKAVCALEGKTMKQVVQKLMEEYVEKAEKKLKK